MEVIEIAFVLEHVEEILSVSFRYLFEVCDGY